jgi:hypothetical protein
MITAAKQEHICVRGNEGQSVLEFLFMLPAVIGLVIVMTRINQAIQVSIVDQQYARAQATFLTFNHPFFPEITLRQAQLVNKNYNQMMIGVADNITPADGSTYNPSATVQNITRKPASQALSLGSSDAQTDDMQARAMVRVRNTVSLCAAPVVLSNGTAVLTLNNVVAQQGQMAQAGQYALTDTTKFNYCSGHTQ